VCVCVYVCARVRAGIVHFNGEDGEDELFILKYLNVVLLTV